MSLFLPSPYLAAAGDIAVPVTTITTERVPAGLMELNGSKPETQRAPLVSFADTFTLSRGSVVTLSVPAGLPSGAPGENQEVPTEYTQITEITLAGETTPEAAAAEGPAIQLESGEVVASSNFGPPPVDDAPPVEDFFSGGGATPENVQAPTQEAVAPAELPLVTGSQDFSDMMWDEGSQDFIYVLFHSNDSGGIDQVSF